MHDERRRIEERVRAPPRPAHQARDLRGHRPPGGRGLAGAGRAGPLRGGRWPPRTRRSRWAPRGARPGGRPGSGCAGRCPPSGPAGASRRSSTSASSATGPASRPRRWSTSPTARPLKGSQPAQPVRADRRPGDGRRADRLPGRGGRQPRHPGQRLRCAHAARRRADRRRRAALHLPARRPRRPRRGGLAPRPRRPGAARADASSCAEHDPRRHEILHALDRGWTPSTWTTSPARAAARPRGARRRPGQARARQRPHRSPASATRTSTPPGCGRIRETKRKTSRTFANVTALADEYPELRLRLLAGPAVRVGHATTTRRSARASRRPSRRASGRRSAACGSRPTATCPAARPSPASSSTASGSSSSTSASRPRASGCPTPSATPPPTRSSPSSPATSGSSPRRSPGTRPTSSRTTPSGGRASTAPASSPTSRRSTPTTRASAARSWPTPCATTTEKGGGTRSLAPFGWGDGGGGPTREMMERARRLRRPGGLAQGRRRAPRRVLRQGPRGVPGRPGLGRRALPGAAPRHLHLPGPHQAGQPPQRTPAARGRVVGDDGRTARAGLRLPVREAGPAVEDGAAAPVPRHPAGLARSPGCTARRRPNTPGWPRSWRS